MKPPLFAYQKALQYIAATTPPPTQLERCTPFVGDEQWRCDDTPWTWANRLEDGVFVRIQLNNGSFIGPNSDRKYTKRSVS